jgi:hypothetical protein
MKIIQHSTKKEKNFWEAPPIQINSKMNIRHTPHVVSGKTQHSEKKL